MNFTKELRALINECDRPEMFLDEEWRGRVEDLFDRRRVSRTSLFLARATIMFNRLKYRLGLDHVALEVVEDESMFPAMAWAGCVVIVGTSLDRLDDDELAFIIAHELGHLYYEDPEDGLPPWWKPWNRLSYRMNRQELEFAADRFARDRVIECGWPGGGSRVLQRMAALDRRSTIRFGLWRAVPFIGWLVVKLKMLQDRWRHSHPSIEMRIERLRK